MGWLYVDPSWKDVIGQQCRICKKPIEAEDKIFFERASTGLAIHAVCGWEEEEESGNSLPLSSSRLYRFRVYRWDSKKRKATPICNVEAKHVPDAMGQVYKQFGESRNYIFRTWDKPLPKEMLVNG